MPLRKAYYPWYCAKDTFFLCHCCLTFYGLHNDLFQAVVDGTVLHRKICEQVPYARPSLAHKRRERVYSKKQGSNTIAFFKNFFFCLAGGHTSQIPHALPSCRLCSLGPLFSTAAIMAAWWGSEGIAFVIIFDSKGHPKSKVKYFLT